MSKIVRLGDQSDHGGEMVSANANFIVNGIKGCVDGDLHRCPKPGHGTTPVTSTSRTQSNGKGILRVGDEAQCGAKLIQGSGNADSV